MTDKTPFRLRGIIGSTGVALACAYVFRRRLEITKTPLEKDAIRQELERLHVAVERTRRDIQSSQEEARQRHGPKYAAIFDSHLLMLSDPQFLDEVVRRVKKENVNVESIIRETLDAFLVQFSQIEDDYLRERAVDMQDVGDRLLRHLLGVEGPAREMGDQPYILVAGDVTPSELLEFARGNLRGICLDSGGATSHVAILAGALGIPSLFGLNTLAKITHTGDSVLLDTRGEGMVILHPTEDDRQLMATGEFEEIVWDEVPDRPATREQHCPVLGANIARVEELSLLEKLKIKRVGLFRSEFLFMESVDPPSEGFQESVYRRVVQAAPEMTVLRVFDIGSDKPVKYLPVPFETNPSMGFRSIRFALSRPDLLKAQLRAMIRASGHGNVRIIFPMVSVPEELHQIDNIWKQVLDEVSPARAPEWGIMVEVPSAIFMIDKIARFTRYISLGTNDLLQFFYGIDRTNEKLSSLAHPLCIPFLRILSYAVVAAKAEGVTVAICGEMAGNPEGFCVLSGIGFDEFSMNPKSLIRIKELIPQLSLKDLSAFVFEILSGDLERNIIEELHRTFPAVFPRKPGKKAGEEKRF